MNVMKMAVPSEPRTFSHFIGGKWTPLTGPEIVRNSPAHGQPVSVVRAGTAEDVNRAVEVARARFENGGWANVPAAGRAAIIRKAADMILARCEELALAETLETGKPIWQSRNEVNGAAGLWHYAAGLAQATHGETYNTLGDGSFGFFVREPIGVVGVITPWNFPFFILAERLPFILAAGCTCVIKPSEFTSSTTLMMADILAECGLPDGVVNIVTGYGNPVGQAIVDHNNIDMVSFTGSTRVGKMALAASAGNVKKVGLELGGKNPIVVFPDADLDKAADGIVFGVCFNAGQTCVSGSRLIVAREVMEPLAEKVSNLMSKLQVGDPLDPSTKVGPIVNETQFARILGLIDAGKKAGGTLLRGGGRTGPANGYFVEPTLIGGVTQSNPVAREEIFGPVLSMMPFTTTEEAIQLANDTEYGLSAMIWTENMKLTMQAARKIKAGRVWVNSAVAAGPEMPIGGFKQSGLGRETGRYGVDEYCEIKSVVMDLGARQLWVDPK